MQTQNHTAYYSSLILGPHCLRTLLLNIIGYLTNEQKVDCTNRKLVS